MAEQSLEQALEERTEALGFELVELERTGAKNRPVLRVRVDRPDSRPGEGVGLEDCARISRALEEYLDALETLPSNYVLEVSSPGVERPLVKRRDFERFAGHEVAVKGYAPLAGRGKRVQGELLGIDGTGEGETLRLRLEDGEEVEVARSDVAPGDDEQQESLGARVARPHPRRDHGGAGQAFRPQRGGRDPH